MFFQKSVALAPPNRACREVKSRRPSSARSASGVDTISRKGKFKILAKQIEKLEFPKLGGATCNLAYS